LLASLGSRGAQAPYLWPKHDTFVYDEHPAFIGTFVRGEKTCLDVSPQLSAPFFEGVVWRKTKNGSIFRKEGQLIHEFPNEVDLSLHFTLMACGPNRHPSVIPMTPKDVAEWMDSLRFGVAWKRGPDVEPVIELTPFVLDEPPKPFRTLYGWTFTARIISRNVALTDHIVVSLFGHGNSKIMRFSFGLDAPAVAYRCCL
jgi:hypothetical protein